MSELARELAQIVGDDGVSTDAADRFACARDLWPRGLVRLRAGMPAATAPAFVVWPRNPTEVAEIVRLAAASRVPLVPFGAGSGVCGGVLPTADAVVVDLKRMRAVRRIDGSELEVEAEAGVLGQHLEDRLLEVGLTLGHYPSSIMTSTLGGWIAARSAGQCSGRYGKIEDMVLALEVVDGLGRVHQVERDGPGGALVPLVIGSEGTLGIVTSARLRVAPAPASRRFAAFSMPTTESGLDAIRRIYQAGLRPAVARLYDPVDTALAKRVRGAPSRGRHHDTRQERKPHVERRGPSLESRVLRHVGAVNALVHALGDETLGGALMVLVWESHATLADVEHDLATAIAREQGGRALGDGPAQRWLLRRHAVSYRQSPTYAGGAFADTMEVAAPWSRLLGVYRAVRAAVAPHVFVLAHFSHAYPHGGSIYFTFAGSAADGDALLARYDATWRDGLLAAVDAGATLSHHHGVGRSKAPAMRREQGAAVDLVRALQRTLDPARILNPGALVPGDDDPTKPPAPTSARERETVELDEPALLANLDGSATLGLLEQELRARGYTLAASIDPSTTLSAWISQGMPGRRSPDEDPVDDVLVGLEATLRDGRSLVVKPAPRRAVGPDVLALFRGAGERLGLVDRAVLRVRPHLPELRLAFRFPDATSARRALRRARGLGVRPLASRLDGAQLEVVLAERAELARAMRTVLDDVVRELGGVPAAAPEHVVADAPMPSWPDALADFGRGA